MTKPNVAGSVVLGLVLACAAGAQPRQEITLSTGFILEVERVQADGDTLVLYTGDGQIAVERNAVARITDIPWITPPPSKLPGSTAASTAPTVQDLLRQSAERHGLPEAFVASVAEAESALQPHVVSQKGARGVMQLMPGTAAQLGINPDDPAENIDGGAKLLRELLLRYQNHPDQVRLALAAYNAGTGAVQKHGGVPPYRETTAYVERVLSRYRNKRAAKLAK